MQENSNLTTIAQRFADQSPPKARRASGPESNGHTVRKTNEKVDENTVREAPTQPVDPELETRIPRAHSWDPSQGSEYEYSDEEAANDRANPDVEMKSIRYDAEYEDDDLTDEDSSAENTPKDIGQDKYEDLQDEVRQRSEAPNHDLEVIELKNADRTDNQMAQRYVTRDHDQSDSHESDYDDIDNNRGLYTNPEPREASRFQKHKKLGMFAATPAADGEPVAERYTEPPHRLRDLVERRRVEREQKTLLAKKGRYNLRPRRTMVGDHDNASLVAESFGANKTDPEIESEDDEPRRPRRVTRSMTTNEKAKRVIPRFKAARKTAWEAMGLRPENELHRTKPNRQVAQVVIPATGRSSKEVSRRVNMVIFD
jgi:hypothetical protein